MPVSVTALEDDRSVSMAVVDAVAEAKDVSSTEVQPPLHRVVDADALNQLFRSEQVLSSGAPRVSFTYAGYEVTVRGRDEVVVRPETDAEREDVEYECEDVE